MFVFFFLVTIVSLVGIYAERKDTMRVIGFSFFSLVCGIIALSEYLALIGAFD